MQINRKNRIFKVGNLKIKDCGSIKLKNDCQITFKSKNAEYDVCKKNWGYYATPSINGRLKNFGFRTFMISNKKKKIYIFLVDKNKMKLFKKYLKEEECLIIIELTNFKNFDL